MESGSANGQRNQSNQIIMQDQATNNPVNQTNAQRENNTFLAKKTIIFETEIVFERSSQGIPARRIDFKHYCEKYYICQGEPC
ncbi:2216_t:CDS:2 [Funneliformis geosporum]|nr:2216_t:CDS:2 [Funneliformis geosporum]